MCLCPMVEARWPLAADGGYAAVIMESDGGEEISTSYHNLLRNMISTADSSSSLTQPGVDAASQ